MSGLTRMMTSQPVRQGALSAIKKFVNEPLIELPGPLRMKLPAPLKKTEFEKVVTPVDFAKKVAKKQGEPQLKAAVRDLVQQPIAPDDAGNMTDRLGSAGNHFEASRRRRRRRGGLLSVSELAALLCVPGQPCPYAQ